MPPLIGWDAISQYIEDIWGIPKSTLMNYHREMLNDAHVLKRCWGRAKHIKVFTTRNLVDAWIIKKFHKKSLPPDLPSI